MKKKIPFIIASVLITLFIFSNSMKDADLSGADSRFLSQMMENILAFLRLPTGSATLIVRKAAHIFEFFVQGIMIAGCFSLRYRKRIIYILFFGLLTACCDEYLQLFSQGRAAMIQDVFVDFSGTLLATALGSFVYGFRRG